MCASKLSRTGAFIGELGAKAVRHRLIQATFSFYRSIKQTAEPKKVLHFTLVLL